MEQDNENSDITMEAGLLNMPTREDYERHLVESIQSIWKAASEAAEPYMAELVRLRRFDPPPPLVLTKEQADEIMKHIRPLAS